MLYRIATFIWYVASLLPLPWLYVASDLCYYILYYIVRYRRRLVRRNLTESFPERTANDIVAIEKRFYAFFCDYIVETIKLFSIGRDEMMHRMQFENLEAVEAVLRAGRPCTLCLGHYGNWEWISSLPAWIETDALFGQIYHPLANRLFDRLFLRLRGRFGAHSVAMNDTLQTVRDWRRRGVPHMIGYIADQAPGYHAIHYFTHFLNHDTPVFSGPERISRLTAAAVFYAEVHRPSRGRYVCRFIPIADRPDEQPLFTITERYFRLLETSIRRTPELWLWSHNRWKRTRAEFETIFAPDERARRLSRL